MTDLKAKLKNGYWICFKCADKHGAKSDGNPHTCSIQICSVCDKEVICNAITDWHWPKKMGIEYIWD